MSREKLQQLGMDLPLLPTTSVVSFPKPDYRVKARSDFAKDISFGAVDVHTHVIEDQPVVEQRVRDVLAVIPKENVWVDPDCGLKTRSMHEAMAKMKVTVQAAKALRN